MLAGSEAGEVFALLEGGAGGARGAAEALCGLYAHVREPWLVRALLHYFHRTQSARALELLARAPEPHARHLLDALAEQLRAEPAARRAALAALAPLVARRPAWLPRAPPHPLPRELLRAARVERRPLPLLHALLALAALVPAAPALAAPHWPELAEALLRPAALPSPPPAVRAHLQIAQLALFHALYATAPCSLLEALRGELAARPGGEGALRPLLLSVRLHPALVGGSRAREAELARRLDEHEIVAETRRLALHTPERASHEPPTPPPPPAPPAAPSPGSTAAASRAVAALRPGAEPWFPLAERAGADSAPHTPLPAADVDGAEPPEAAVEATPENTPAKETRAAFRFPADSSAVRALGKGGARKESSPPGALAGGEAGARLARVLADRRAAESPVAFAGAPPPPPPGALRPLPRAAAPRDEDGDADREVGALTAGAEWAEPPAPADPRRRARPARAPRGPPPRRPRSCEPAAARTVSVAVQTVDTWPEPYEFLIADFYRSLPDENQTAEEAQPCERLDAYLSALYSGAVNSPAEGELGEQLALVHAQLLYERWRREAHAERNRRLLGRCRHARALELHVAALRDRLRAAATEREQLRARLQAGRPPRPPPAEPLARLDAALAEERALAARLRAELAEARAEAAARAAELRHSHADRAEAARGAEALARAAALAARRGEHVRRLRRELLVLAEREARLAEAAAAAGRAGPAPEERALRAAAARAEAEAAAAGARAEAAGARAHEAEAALGAREAAVAELRRALRAQAEEGAGRLRALQERYEALMCVLRTAEQRHLERLAELVPPRAAPAPPSPPPDS